MPKPQSRFLHGSLACDGIALLELALVLPILFTLAFATIELSRSLKYSEILSTASREAANSAFRECSLLSDPASCLSDARDNVNGFLASILPQADVVISVYRRDAGGTVTRTAICGVSGMNEISPHGHVSRFSVPEVRANVPSLNASNPLVVISEAFYTFTPLMRTPLVRLIAKELYEKAVY